MVPEQRGNGIKSWILRQKHPMQKPVEVEPIVVADFVGERWVNEDDWTHISHNLEGFAVVLGSQCRVETELFAMMSYFGDCALENLVGRFPPSFFGFRIPELPFEFAIECKAIVWLLIFEEIIDRHGR